MKKFLGLFLVACSLLVSGSFAATVATDDFARHATGLDSDFKHAALVTPDDSNDLTKATRALYIGGAGTLKVTTAGGETLVITGLLANTFIRLRVVRVWSTSTTATNIVALW